MRPTRAAIAVVIAIAATVAGSAVPVGAQAAAARLAAVQSAAAATISARQASITAAKSEIASLTFLGADQAALTSRLDTASSGLTTLGTTIQADTTAAAATADARKVFTDYRIYALVLPAAYLTAAGDRITNVLIPKFDSVGQDLTTAVNTSGKASLQPTLADFNAKVAAAQSAAGGLPAKVAALTPADYNANPSVVVTNRASLWTARSDLRAASADAHTIANAL